MNNPANMSKGEIKTFTPESRSDWREWLKKHHRTEQSVWLLMYKKEANMPTMVWSDAVDEALCFGWIDSTRKSFGDIAFIQFFTRRKPDSNWSKINKEKVARLTEEGLMSKAGLDCISIAKQNGSWTRLDTVEEGIIPKDLEKAFKSQPGSKAYFTGLSKSVRKMILHWVEMARRPETRQKRVDEIAALAALGKKPKHI